MSINEAVSCTSVQMALQIVVYYVPVLCLEIYIVLQCGLGEAAGDPGLDRRCCAGN